jgi:CubicO group peptidase (beta-lactamase class C family)
MRRNLWMTRLAALVLVILLLPVSAKASAPAQPSPWEDAEPFFDGLMAEQFASRPLAGAAVVLVKDGEILFERGYGLADVENDRPVDPQTTLFRIGSVTKLFTWTAVMQLAEENRLNLDADVNLYLDFTIPATYPEPITLRHLMSHTAGFEDRLLGVFIASPEQLEPPARWLPANLPARVRPPGVVSSYSNYGTALSGYIVERVTGQSYEDYLEANIFAPLGMDGSSARQPLPPALARDLSVGYGLSEGMLTAQPFEVVQIAPAGSISATGADMAAFMIAHLQQDRHEDKRILSEATARLMHGWLFRHHEQLSGYAYGFQRAERGGEVILSHGGDTSLFSSLLMLMPDSGAGLFVSYNTANTSRLRAELTDAFLAHFFPVTNAPVVAGDRIYGGAARAAGLYRSNRHAHTTIDKMVLLASPEWKIEAEGGTLVVNHPWLQKRLSFVEVSPLLFQQVDGPERIAFRADERGRVQMAFLNSEPWFALERVPWYESGSFTLALMGLCMLMFLSIPLTAVVRTLARRARRSSPRPQSALARTARWAFYAAAALIVIFLLGTGASAMRLLASFGADEGALAALSILKALPPVIVGLFAVGVSLMAAVWRSADWPLGWRIYHSLLAVAVLASVWFMWIWNLFRGL